MISPPRILLVFLLLSLAIPVQGIELQPVRHLDRYRLQGDPPSALELSPEGQFLQRSVPAPPARMKKEAGYRAEEVLVRLKKGRSVQGLEIFFQNNRIGVLKKFRRISQASGREHLLLRASGMKAEKLLRILARHPQVESISLNYAKSLEQSGECGGAVPGDPFFNVQWGLCNTGQPIYAQIAGTPDADIDATEARGILFSETTPVVVVLDTGVDYNHPDLRNRMWANPQELSGVAGLDDDGNGYVDDIHGIDTGENDADPMDFHGHGTHVAGIIAAESDNGTGGAGVSQRAEVMAVKGFRSDGFLYSSDELEALDYIMDMKQRGVNIVAVNASYGCYGCYNQLEKDALDALGREGIIFVAAAGNEATDSDSSQHYPSSYTSSNVISVAATDMHDSLASFSNYGISSVDLGAPGDYVFSTYFRYYYRPGEGEDFFYDDVESGVNGWVSHSGWQISEEESYSLTHAWTDSPWGNYPDNVQYELVSPVMDLSLASGPQFLGFKVLHDLEDGFDWLDIYYRMIKSTSWQLTSEKSFSGLSAWSDSPGGDYPNNSDNWLASPAINLAGAGGDVRLSFLLTGKLEENFDYLHLYFSGNGGKDWLYFGSISSDLSDNWYRAEAPIASSLRSSQFRLAFVVESDGLLTYDGIYIDDVVIQNSTQTYFADNMETGAPGWGKDIASWDYKGSITGSSSGSWRTYTDQIETEYFGENFQVKFVLFSDCCGNAEGVSLDDIGIGSGQPLSTYAYMSGTSMAAPHVSGAAAFLAGAYPAENYLQRMNRIFEGVDSKPSLTGKTLTGGRLNLYNSLFAVQTCRGDLDGDGDVDGLDLAGLGAGQGVFSPEDVAAGFGASCP